VIDIRQAFGIVSVVVSHGSMDRLTWDMRTRQKASRFFLSNSTAYNGVARDFQPWWGEKTLFMPGLSVQPHVPRNQRPLLYPNPPAILGSCLSWR
jgi:hypothetical protein